MQIAVAGAGISGTAFAVAVRALRLRATLELYERADGLRSAGAGLWLGPNALRVLAALGVASSISSDGVSLERIEVVDLLRTRLLMRIEGGWLRRRFGWSVLSLRRSWLAERLLASSPTPRWGHTVVGIEMVPEGRTRLRLASGASIEAELVVGADGIGSAVRGAIAPAVQPKSVGQVTYRGLAPITVPPVGRELYGKGVRFGWSPVDARTTYWFATLSSDWDDAEWRRHFATFPEPVPSLLAAVDQPLRTPLQELRRHVWQGGPRVALVGDAAHAMTPNLGQGAAMAIEDAWALAVALGASPVPKAIGHYVQQRRRRVRTVASRSRRLGTLVHLLGFQRCLAFAAWSIFPAAWSRRLVTSVYGGGPLSDS